MKSSKTAKFIVLEIFPLYGTQGQVKGEDNSDILELFDNKAQGFTDFNPIVNNDNDWDVDEVINAFLQKHFSRAVTTDKRQAIMEDFPESPSKGDRDQAQRKPTKASRRPQ